MLPAPPLGFTQLISAAAGGPIPLSPKNQYMLTATYTLPLDRSIGRVAVSVTFSHRDNTIGSTSSKLAQQIVPAQNLLNLSANWNDVGGHPLDLGVFVTNATNNKFYTFTSGASFGFDSYIANQPRMFGLRARVRFGR